MVESQVEVEEVGPCKVKLKVAVPKERVQEELRKNYQQLRSHVQLKGFRKGKIPQAILEKRFGTEVESEIKRTMVAESLEVAVRDKGLEPLQMPDVDDDAIEFGRDTGLTFELELNVKPRFKVPDLDEVEVTQPAIEIGDDEIDEAMQRMRAEFAQVVPVEEDAQAQDGDTLFCDVRVEAEGEEAVEEEDVLVRVHPEHNRLEELDVEIEGLHGALVGAGVDATLELTGVRKPFEDHEHGPDCDHDHDDAEEGTPVSVHLKVNEIKRLQLPELTEEWAEEVGYDSLAEVRQELIEAMARQKEHQVRSQVEEAIIEELLERVDIEVSDELIEGQQGAMLAQFVQFMQTQGLPPDELTERLGKFKEDTRASSLKFLQTQFLLDRVAASAGISVSESELEAALKGLAQRYNQWPHELRQQLEREGRLDEIRHDLRMQKARSYLRGQVKVRELQAGETAGDEEE